MWLFDPDDKPQLAHPPLGPLPIHNHDSNQIATIKYCDPDTATKYLSCYKALSGKQSKQLEVLTTKTNQEATFLLSSSLNPNKTKKYYSAVFLPLITAAMTCSYFT